MTLIALAAALCLYLDWRGMRPAHRATRRPHRLYWKF